jgi:hypothetical protein
VPPPARRRAYALSHFAHGNVAARCCAYPSSTRPRGTTSHAHTHTHTHTHTERDHRNRQPTAY